MTEETTIKAKIVGTSIVLSQPVGKEVEGGLLILEKHPGGIHTTGLNTNKTSAIYTIPAFVDPESIDGIYIKIS